VIGQASQRTLLPGFLFFFPEYEEEAFYWSQWDDNDELVVDGDSLVDKTNVADSSPKANGVSHDQVVPKPAARVKYLSDSHEEKWNEIVFADKSVSGDKSVSRRHVQRRLQGLLSSEDDVKSCVGMCTTVGAHVRQQTSSQGRLRKSVSTSREPMSMGWIRQQPYRL
jgi:hypothetical protein